MVIDVAIQKDATSPTPLNGTVTYTLTVRNVGTTTATDVQVGDPAPAGIEYQSATASAGVSCIVTTGLVTCSRPGSFPAGASFTVTVLAKATRTGTFVNTATVAAGGGSEANMGNNEDKAETLVTSPATPPKVKPKPKPKPKAKTCAVFIIQEKTVTAGSRSNITITVVSGGKRVPGAKLRIKGPGIDKIVTADGKVGW